MRSSSNVGHEFTGELVPVALRVVGFVGQAVDNRERNRKLLPGRPVSLEIHRPLHIRAVDVQRTFFAVEGHVISESPKTQRRMSKRYRDGVFQALGGVADPQEGGI